MADTFNTDRLERAFIKAHEAGDVEAAKALAQELRSSMMPDKSYSVMSPDPNVELARETPPWEAALVGAGKSADSIVQGIRQMVASPQEKAAMESEQTRQNKIYAPLRAEHPIATGIGEAAPTLAIPGRIPALTQAAIAGGIGTLKYGDAKDRITNAILDAGVTGLGAIAGKAIGGIVDPVRAGAMTETRRQALQDARQIGVLPRLSEVTGSPTAARLEDTAARIPGGAGVMQDFMTNNQRAINRVATAAVGQAGEEMSPGVFQAARNAQGKVFDSIKSLPGRFINIDANVGNVADDILRQQAKMVTPDAQLTKIAQNVRALSRNKGRIDGEAYQLQRSDLSKLAYETDGTNGTLYAKLRDALDDAAEASLRRTGRDDLAESLRIVRPQYAALKSLESGTVAKGGNVDPEKLASEMRRRDPSAFRRGANTSNLGAVARYGEAAPALRPGSQTMERQVMTSPLEAAALAIPYAAIAKFNTNPLVTGYVQKVGGRPVTQMAAEATRRGSRAVTEALMRRYLDTLRGD